MHRNTLTRIIQKLEIDPKLVRGGCVADRMIKPWLLVTPQSVWRILVIA